MNFIFKPKTFTFLFFSLLLVITNSCNLLYIHKAKKGKLEIEQYNCFEPISYSENKQYSGKKYPFNVATFQTNTSKFFSTNDTVLSIGARDGAFEFMSSFFIDSITYYLVDIDSSCLSQYRIDNIYLPAYNKIKSDISYYNLYKSKSKIRRDTTKDYLFKSKLNDPINCEYKFILGTATTINIKDKLVNKIYINRTYHHFTNPEEMISECKRILVDNGTLIIGEYVTSWNRKTYKHCSQGGYYKTEKNFIENIESQGFIIDTVYRDKDKWREFVFIKQ